MKYIDERIEKPFRISPSRTGAASLPLTSGIAIKRQ